MSCCSSVYVTPDRDDLVDRELGQIPPQKFPLSDVCPRDVCQHARDVMARLGWGL